MIRVSYFIRAISSIFVAMAGQAMVQADQIVFSWDASPAQIPGTTVSMPKLTVTGATQTYSSAAIPQEIGAGILSTNASFNPHPVTWSYPVTPVTLALTVSDQTTGQSGALTFRAEVGGSSGGAVQDLQFQVDAGQTQLVRFSNGLGYRITLESAYGIVLFPSSSPGSTGGTPGAGALNNGFSASVESVNTSNAPGPSCALLGAIGLAWVCGGRRVRGLEFRIRSWHKHLRPRVGQ